MEAITHMHPSGTIIAGRYEAVEGPREKKHYQGGMGFVYFCRDRVDDCPVALKTFQPQFLSNRIIRDAFLRECTLWIELGQHPFLVQANTVVRASPDGRELYLVLEYIAPGEGKTGASLREWLRPGQAPLSLIQSLTWMWEIAQGLAYAVEKQPGFVHRDVKPENILIGRDGHARVTDLGLARCLSLDTFPVEVRRPEEVPTSSDDLTVRRTCLTRHAIGTPLYMAPELWQGSTDLDVRTDIYAWGCVLLELLTGFFPVKGKTLEELEQGHVTGQAFQATKTLPLGLRKLVEQCVAVHPADRCSSWTTLLAKLEKGFSQWTQAPLPPSPISLTNTRGECNAKGWSLNALGLSYQDIGKPRVGIEYFQKVLSIAEDEQAKTLQMAALCHLGNAYKVLGNPTRAIAYYEQHLAIARAIKDRKEEGRALGNLGNVYADLGELEKAIMFYEHHLDISRSIDDREGEGTALCNLGIAYKELGKPRRAISNLQQYLAFAQPNEDKIGIGTALNNLGSVFRTLGEPKRAIAFSERALGIFRGIGHPEGEGAALCSLGSAYAE